MVKRTDEPAAIKAILSRLDERVAGVIAEAHDELEELPLPRERVEGILQFHLLSSDKRVALVHSGVLPGEDAFPHFGVTA